MYVLCLVRLDAWLDNFYFISTQRRVIDQIERNSKGPLPFVRVTGDRTAA